MKGYVYGIQSGQLIKVGAADNLQKRLHTFRLHNPHPLKIVLRRTITENYWMEKRMHRLLAQYAIGREWFDCSPKVVRDAFEAALSELIVIRHQIVGTPKGWVRRTPDQTIKPALPCRGTDICGNYRLVSNPACFQPRMLAKLSACNPEAPAR